MTKKALHRFLWVAMGILLFSFGMAAQTSIHLEEAGKLKDSLGEQYGTTSHLIVTGKINAQDLKDASFMTALEELDLGGATLYSNNGETPANVPSFLFSYVKKIRKITLPQGVKVIEQNAFYKCENLQEMILQEGIETIQASVFMSCTQLSRINLPKSLKKIMRNAFYKTWALESFTAPENLEQIGENAFYNSGIKRATLNAKLTTIGAAAFGGCLLLEEFVVDAASTRYKVDAVDKALYSFDGSMLISYPQGSKATSYKNPTGVKALAPSAFDGAVNLEKIRLGDNIQILPKSLFFGCKNLKQVFVGESVDSIDIGIFEQCLDLAEFHIRAVRVPRCADQPFCIFNCPKKITLYAPASSIEDYKASAVFGKVFMEFLPDNDEGDTDPNQDLVLLEENFEKETASTTQEWSGNSQFTSEKGAYIRAIESTGNKVLRLGNNEENGSVKTHVLNLSGNDGNFRVRFDFDGWNDHVRSVWVDLVEGDQVLGTQKVSVYNPEMGADLRTFDLPFSRGSEKSQLIFRTDASQRIAILDNIKVYTTTANVASYKTDKEVVDFGKCVRGKVPEKQLLTLSLKHNNQRPIIKLLSEHVGIFTADIVWTNEELATISIALDASNKGEYSAFLQINLNNVNVLMIPIQASVVDRDNPLDLDDSNPLTELNEDFEKYTTGKIPAGWKIVTLEGHREWSVRKDAKGNRCMSINALETEGNVHSLLVLPPLDVDRLQDKELKLNLTTAQPNGAKLRVVRVDKASGELQLLQDITQQEETTWKEIAIPLKGISGVSFFAVEYQGVNEPNEKKTTIYRVDNVRIEGIGTSITNTLHCPIQIQKEGVLWHISADRPFSIFNSLGNCLAISTLGEMKTISITENEIYFIKTETKTFKVIAR